MKTQLICLAGCAFLANACLAADDDIVVLHDPITSEAVGYKDTASDTYYLDGPGLELKGTAIDRSIGEASQLPGLRPASYTLSKECEQTSGQTVCVDDDGSSCWSMIDCKTNQCVSCTGCCKKKADGSWACWENCYDTMSNSYQTR